MTHKSQMVGIQLPTPLTLTSTRRAAAECRACPLWRDATQTVFGEGPRRASILIVGEVPGDREDLAGKPFIGPAGKLLDQALERAGIDRANTYVTNAVKHFKFVVALGATAAQSLMGPSFRVTRDRGQILESEFAPHFLATVHPSSLLRGPAGERESGIAALASDLAQAKTVLE